MNHYVAGTVPNFFTWRLAAWAGPIFIFGFLICWAIIAKFLPPPPQYWSADEVYKFYIDYNLQIRVGMTGVLFFGPFYFIWSAVISRLIQRMEGPDGVLSYIELMGGVCTVMVTLGLGVMWLGASFRTETRTPQDVQLLHDVGWLIFNMTFVVTFLQMIGFGTAMLIDKRERPLYPRWMGWASYFAALTFLVVLFMPFVMRSPFAWHGLLTYYVSLGAYFIWALLAMYYTFGAITQVELECGAVSGAGRRAADQALPA